jgi:plasmid stabilization system protein ParE
MVYSHSIYHAAEADIKEAVNYYADISSDLSQALLITIDTAIQEIKHNPLLFQSINKIYRKANLKRFPYKIIFRVKKEEILIVAFAHHKRKPNYWKKR